MPRRRWHSRKDHEITESLAGSGKVRAVFQGHGHEDDDHEIAGIPYITLVAMVEGSGAGSSGYATVDSDEAGSIRVHGVRKQASYGWPG